MLCVGFSDLEKSDPKSNIGNDLNNEEGGNNTPYAVERKECEKKSDFYERDEGVEYVKFFFLRMRCEHVPHDLFGIQNKGKRKYLGVDDSALILRKYE